MSIERPSADPELAPLLAEVVGARSSTLLRVTPTQLRHMLVEKDPRPGAMKSLLSRAEQRLLETHHEDVARLLVQASQWVLYHDPTWENVLHRSISIDRSWRLPERSELLEKSQAAPRLFSGDSPTQGLLNMLASEFAVEGRCGISGEEMAASSLRLAPSDEARIYLALYLLGRGQIRSAKRLLENVIENASSQLNSSIALEDVGLCWQAMDRLDLAASSYELSARKGERRVEPLASAVTLYFQLGEKKKVLEAAHELDHTVPAENDALSAFLNQAARDALTGPIGPSKAASLLTRRVLDQLGPSSRRLASALFA